RQAVMRIIRRCNDYQVYLWILNNFIGRLYTNGAGITFRQRLLLLRLTRSYFVELQAESFIDKWCMKHMSSKGKTDETYFNFFLHALQIIYCGEYRDKFKLG